MVVKPVLVALCVTAAAGAPIAIPIASGMPVTVAVGPVAFTYDESKQLDIDLNAGCLVDGCSLLEIIAGEPSQDGFRIRI